MIDTPRYKLAEKRVRYSYIQFVIAALYVVFILGLRLRDPEFGFELIHIFLPLVFVVLGWTMRASGHHDMREEHGAA